jgi:D-alanine-D-alanine ligase
VEPSREDSGVGVHIVRTLDDLEAALADAARSNDDTLIEEFIGGKELINCILDDQVLPRAIIIVTPL